MSVREEQKMPVAYVTFSCARDRKLLAIALEAVKSVAAPGSTFTLFVDEKDPIPRSWLSRLDFEGLTIRYTDNGNERLNGRRFLAFQLDLYLRVIEANPDAAYLAKFDSDVLILRDSTRHIRATERFMALGTLGREWGGFWGGLYFLHQRAIRSLCDCDFDLLLQTIRSSGGMKVWDKLLPEDEFLGRAVRLLYGDENVYFREPEPWVEGWFDAFHFDGRDGIMADEAKGQFFDAVEFGRRGEFDEALSLEEKIDLQVEAMLRVWQKHRRGDWTEWPVPPAKRLHLRR